MSTVYVYRDEYYPFMGIDASPRFATAIDVNPARLGRWRRVMREFQVVQDQMRTAEDDVLGRKG